MKATAIIRNLSEEFWTKGLFDGTPGFVTQSPNEQFRRLENLKGVMPQNVSVKVGNGSFRDKCDLNSMLKQPHDVSSKIESRRGYKLVTFVFSKQ